MKNSIPAILFLSLLAACDLSPDGLLGKGQHYNDDYDLEDSEHSGDLFTGRCQTEPSEGGTISFYVPVMPAEISNETNTNATCVAPTAAVESLLFEAGEFVATVRGKAEITEIVYRDWLNLKLLRYTCRQAGRSSSTASSKFVCAAADLETLDAHGFPLAIPEIVPYNDGNLSASGTPERAHYVAYRVTVKSTEPGCHAQVTYTDDRASEVGHQECSATEILSADRYLIRQDSALILPGLVNW